MVSPYLRRRLRSLEEMASERRDPGASETADLLLRRRAAGGSVVAAIGSAMAPGAAARGADTEKSEARAAGTSVTAVNR